MRSFSLKSGQAALHLHQLRANARERIRLMLLGAVVWGLHTLYAYQDRLVAAGPQPVRVARPLGSRYTRARLRR